VEIMQGNMEIPGSPFFVEIYDPNKIIIEGKRRGRIGEWMEFESKNVV